MHMLDVINKKRKNERLTKEEITYFVNGYTKGDIPDYQASAFLMAICFNGLSDEETFWLTEAMKNSGDVIDLSPIHGIKVDKHSTGGVGDKTTFIVAAIASACGVPVAKMSGRGLGFTGGTVDKMESISGFQTSLTREDFIRQVNKIGISVIGQTGKIAPADKKIYALRDVTGTVESIGLVASSVMSKKLAAGSDAILLDVKCGSGAFMKDLTSASKLGELMVEIGKRAGKNTRAIITDMNQPLGNAVGNALEVIESIDTLKGTGPEDITELSLVLASHMIYLGEKASTPEIGYQMAKQSIDDGSALAKLETFIQTQGGNPEVVRDYTLFGAADYSEIVVADRDGFITQITADVIGRASQISGAGRETKEDSIDFEAGIVLHRKIGNSVKAGDPLATVYSNDPTKLIDAAKMATTAYKIQDTYEAPPALVKKMIE